VTAAARKDKVWKRKRQVRERYGNCSDRTIDRMVKANKLPAPQYPLGNSIPFWAEDELDESDRAAAAAYRNLKTTTTQA
jgi:hypothetical protein